MLPNNKLLHKMGIKNSALCNFCNQEEDSILHYLKGCPVAKRFWTSFNIWLSSALDLEVNKRINIFDFLFLFNFNFENVKDWFCVSPFTKVNIISPSYTICRAAPWQRDFGLHLISGFHQL
jgi:hypothetical protein